MRGLWTWPSIQTIPIEVVVNSRMLFIELCDIYNGIKIASYACERHHVWRIETNRTNNFGKETSFRQPIPVVV